MIFKNSSLIICLEKRLIFFGVSFPLNSSEPQKNEFVYSLAHPFCKLFFQNSKQMIFFSGIRLAEQMKNYETASFNHRACAEIFAQREGSLSAQVFI